MQKILLTENLGIKKLNPNNPPDMLLIEELCQDRTVCGEYGYLWPRPQSFNSGKHLQHQKLIDSPYIIYQNKYPIGFLEISDIFIHDNLKNVSITYALHKNARRKGYMQTTLQRTSDLLLTSSENIEGVILSIDPANILSKNVARKSGFIENKEWSLEYHSGGNIIYQKTRK
ncbi:MAG TPA: GNAT family N-acetyltransferase [Candidatus Faecimonas gallistercoris]|nr:GNAT family N-acetyltransferase [Candidatus Faecimonas gallistercoris]